MKKLAFLGGAAALSLVALFHAPIVQAADHLDAPTVKTNPMADINDVYAWMTSDATKVNLAMTVSPADPGDRAFGPTVQYVFHVQSHPGFLMPGVESKVICTFTSNTAGQCWIVDPDGAVVDYVTGNFSAAAGVASASGKLRVFAGRRADPFFFNLAGFLTAQAYIRENGQALPKDAAGCPDLQTSTLPALLRSQLTSTATSQVGPCAPNQADCFLNFNVMAIVVQADKDQLLNTTGTTTDKLVTVWASTHAAP